VTDKQTIDYYDDFAGWYENERRKGYHAMLDALELEVLGPFAEKRDVLEVGAGTGLIMAGLNGTPRRLVGLDISAGMLKKASLKGFQVVQGSATALPFDSGRFDVVYSFKVLAHIPDIEAAVAEMVRVLRPGGHLIAEFYNARSLRRLAKRLAGPGQISENRTENDVFTRWDTQRDIISYLPPNVELKKWRGIRVLTPAAAAFKLPGVRKVLPRLERRAMSSPLAAFGGFLVAICQKRSSAGF
jgi:ubiquinone/menaquinone biosynthesis C-methylase UbiE